MTATFLHATRVWIFFLLQGVAKVDSTGVPAERSDYLSAQDPLARSFFQVPQ